MLEKECGQGERERKNVALSRSSSHSELDKYQFLPLPLSHIVIVHLDKRTYSETFKNLGGERRKKEAGSLSIILTL